MRFFRFRAIEETIISAAFALAGVASLTGILHTSNVAGWLAIGAAIAGVVNTVVTRRSRASGSETRPMHIDGNN